MERSMNKERVMCMLKEINMWRQRFLDSNKEIIPNHGKIVIDECFMHSPSENMTLYSAEEILQIFIKMYKESHMDDKDDYFSITSGEGSNKIRKIENIEKFLEEHSGTTTVFVSDFPEDRWTKKRNIIDNDTTLESGEYEEILIIKGKIVVPIKKEIVIKYEIK